MAVQYCGICDFCGRHEATIGMQRDVPDGWYMKVGQAYIDTHIFCSLDCVSNWEQDK